MDPYTNWIGVAVTVMVPVLAGVVAAIARNGRDVARLAGRLDVLEKRHGHLEGQIDNVHQRVGGIGRTADRICGQNTQIGSTLAAIQKHLLGGSGGRDR